MHVDTIRRDTHEQVRARARAQLAGDRRQVLARLPGQVLLERRDLEVVVVLQRVGLGDDPPEPGLRHLVVGAVHQQHVGEANGAELLFVVGGPEQQALGVLGDVAAVGVGAVQVLAAHLRPVGRDPEEAGLVDRRRDAAPRDRVIDADELQELRHLRDVPEDVGQVPDRHRAAVLRGLLEPELQVPDDGLARHHELVHLDHPRPERDAARRREPPQRVGRLGPHLEVVVDDRGLPVEQEARVGHVRLEQRQQRVEQLDEPHPERLERRVPLAVPVRVRDDRDGDRRLLGHARQCKSSGIARVRTPSWRGRESFTQRAPFRNLTLLRSTQPGQCRSGALAEC